MHLATCGCGAKLVMEQVVVGRLHQCPKCEAPIEVTGLDLLAVAPDEDTRLWTKTCACGKILVVDHEGSDRMLRCPACDRLIDKFHDFGREFWRPQKPAATGPAAEAAPAKRTLCDAKPLQFSYARGGLTAILCGALMLATAAVPWHLVIGGAAGAEAVGVSSRGLLGGFLESLKGPADLLACDVPTLAAGSWLAGLIAIAAGAALRGKPRFLVIAAVGLTALVFQVRILWLMPGHPATLPQVLPAIAAMALLVPLAVAVNVRLRVGPRRGTSVFIAIAGSLLVIVSLTALAHHIIGLWDGAEFWQSLKAAGGSFLDFPGLPLSLSFLAGAGGLILAIVRRWDSIGFALLLYALMLGTFGSAIALGVLDAGLAVAIIIVLAAVTASLLMIGATNFLAMCLATPEDWQRL